MRDTLIQIGRTALLCGILGLALYCAMSYGARFPAFAPGLALAGALALAWLAASSIRYAFRHRLIPARGRSVARDDQPVLYWGLLGFEFVAGGASIAVAILSLMRLVEAMANGGLPKPG